MLADICYIIDPFHSSITNLEVGNESLRMAIAQKRLNTFINKIAKLVLNDRFTTVDY